MKRAYGDWSTGKGSSALLELGIEPVQVFRTGSSGKNASDIRLTIDAVDLLHQSPVDVFVLASSDTDFIPLVSKLRAAGKMVIGAGRESAVGASSGEVLRPVSLPRQGRPGRGRQGSQPRTSPFSCVR